MLFWLFDRMFPCCLCAAEALRGTPLRAVLAGAASLALVIALGPSAIGWLRRHVRERIKSDSAEVRRMHRAKQSTPTMGGLFILAAMAAAVAAVADPGNRCVQAALLLAAGLMLVGAADDLVKLFRPANGLSARAKLAGQTAVALAAALLLYEHNAVVPGGLSLQLPLVGHPLWLGWWFVPWAVLVIVGTSNAVNLTDGLDGLASGCLICATAGMGAAAYATSVSAPAEGVWLPWIAGAREMTILAGAMVGAVLGFLRFNVHPAKVFMGDTGALPLGGLLGLLAVAIRQELLLLVVGGVLVAEAGSVVLQVGCFKWRRRRIFLCAPLHHHFQLQGWPEPKIVVGFWAAAAFCALIGLTASGLGWINAAAGEPGAMKSLGTTTIAASEWSPEIASVTETHPSSPRGKSP